MSHPKPQTLETKDIRLAKAEGFQQGVLAMMEVFSGKRIPALMRSPGRPVGAKTKRRARPATNGPQAVGKEKKAA